MNFQRENYKKIQQDSDIHYPKLKLKIKENGWAMEINIKKEINTYLFVLFKLMGGFFLAALGIVFMIKANLGLSPWDVLHQGITKVMPMTMGQANIVVGIIVVILSVFLGVKIGIGTILNTIFILSIIHILLSDLYYSCLF